ncbi:MAG: hypothetical protein M1831_007309 [Alyxoria varia]|nr:MAG: hypothetical protein M1831_007309 [Alyxoria varia]
MVENLLLRKSLVVWGLRVTQAVFVFIALGLSAATASAWDNSGCLVPGKDRFQVAAPSITIPALLYLLLVTGKKHLSLFWNQWVQLGIDLLYLAIWAAAVGTSIYVPSDCDNLCDSCSIGLTFSMTIGNHVCTCLGASTYDYTDYYDDYYYAKKLKMAKRGAKAIGQMMKREEGPEFLFDDDRQYARLAFDVLMLVTFLATTILTVFYIVKNRKTTRPSTYTTPTNNHTTPTTTEAAPHYGQEEKAVATENTYEAPAYTATDTNNTYNNTSNTGYYGNSPAVPEMPAAPPAAQRPQ